MRNTKPAFSLWNFKWSYILKLTAFAVIIILLGLTLMVAEISRRIVTGLTIWDCPVPSRTPADIGLTHYQTVQIQPQPGQTLTGWYLPSQNGAAVLLLQGHWTARDGMLPEAGILARHGYGIMLLDPHPCAGPGVVHTMGQAEIADIAAAVKFMRQQPDIIGDRMGVLGFSIGGVLAVESAARLPEIKGVVAEGNFDDLTTNITPRGARETLVGSLVQGFIVFFFRYYTGTDPALVRPIDSVAKISPRPLFFIAGEYEAEANRTQAQFEAAGQPKELWLVPQVGHGGYGDRWPEEYERRIAGFFNEHLLTVSP
ncbi:MAG: prolyl oligopeptidase family serine peptidase [Anaerolineae bacterium]|nr:prolyl oligopeptidase family serine peptidase [Anaerolineae bacterium]